LIKSPSRRGGSLSLVFVQPETFENQMPHNLNLNWNNTYIEQNNTLLKTMSVGALEKSS
jgi:hypothetical protein